MSRERNDSDSDMGEEVQPSVKRTRLSNPAAEGNGSNSLIPKDTTNLSVGDDGFVEGSIVKITLTNFVTYDYCEIHPGPQMNMIIGPNGTGKSTIVCAIALGLGGTPSLLGRAKNINEFVKTGEDEATITVELKKVNTRNVVIQRSFKKSSNQNSWKLNGKTCPQRDVMEIIESLNIQVDNLCQFLPQDRVAEFAELSPSQLLERTQAAAGETELHQLQLKLIEMRNKEKEFLRSLGADTDHIKALKNRNAELQKDVFRMQTKQQIDNRIALLEAQIPLAQYTESKARSERYREEALKQKKIWDDAKAEILPIRAVQEAAENDYKKMLRQRENDDRKNTSFKIKLKDQVKKMSEYREVAKTNRAQIDKIKAKLPEREQEIESIKKKIDFLEKGTQEKPSEDYSEFEKGIAGINNEKNDVANKMEEIKQDYREQNRSKQHEMSLLANKKKELNNLNDVRKARSNKISKIHPDTARAFRWYQEHKSEFKGRVFGPLALFINVNDPKYADIVEQCLGGARSSLFRTMLFEEKEDYEKFTHECVDKMGMRLSLAWPDRISDNVLKTPLSKEELSRKFGMEQYVHELIECPDIVLKYICQDKRINLIPVALQHPQPQQVVNSGIFMKFGIGKTFYTVKNSTYGSGSRQTMTVPVRAADLLGDTIDNEAKTTIIEEIRTSESHIQDIDANIKENGNKLDKLDREMQELDHKKEDLQAQKRDIQTKVKRYQYNVSKLEEFKESLTQAEKKPEEDRRRIKEIEETIKEGIEIEVADAKKYTEMVTKQVDLYEKRNETMLESTFVTEKFLTIAEYAKTQTQTVELAKAQLETAKKEYNEAENQTKRFMAECRNAGNNLAEELVEDFQQILGQWKEGQLQGTKAELDQQIAAEKGKSDAISFANPNAMRNYEERLTEIKKLEGKISNNKAETESLQAEIRDLRGQWEPRVDALVERINEKFIAAFARIKCAGEVAVDKYDDFDKWGINISVKFRDNEKLQLLTGQRQSGGERSVTTVLYLMSLQDLAKSPFRVVDEINQGMDPRNERMIHEQIVQGASRPGTSQYFLITPKLLPDLFYNERMRVLCIYNGEWLPTKIKPLSEFLTNARSTSVS